MQTPEGEPSTVLRLIDTIKYLVGIAERGEGRKARDDELPEQFVLGYVKRLEAALAEPSEADDTSCPTCGEDGGTSCGMPNCGLLIGESDVEPQNEPVAWQLGHRFYTSLKDAEYAWRNDCAFLGTSYVPEPLFTHPASNGKGRVKDTPPSPLTDEEIDVITANGYYCPNCGLSQKGF